MKTIGTLAILIAFMTAACAPLPTGGVRPTGKYQPYTVVLQPKANPAPGTLDLKSGNQGCTQGGGAKPGCVRFAPSDFGTITFALFQERAGIGCADNADWVITRVELSATGDPATGKGTFGGAQPAWLLEAFPGTDPNTGVLFSGDKNTGMTTFPVFDWNNHDARDGVKEAYYQVTATNCRTGQAVDIDPMVENTGRER